MHSALRNPARSLLIVAVAAATTAGAPPVNAQAADVHPKPVHRLTALPALNTAGTVTALARQAMWATDQAHRADRERAQKTASSTAARRAAKNTAEARAKKQREAAARTSYPDTLDGWIREALAVMHDHGIPGSYAGIHRNILRESGGDPNAVNDWDINAKNGTPSTGLLQVIRPTFEAYHVPGTAWSLTDPVANITAACNYAADRYGSIDHVDSAY